jgi:hypothetical protein
VGRADALWFKSIAVDGYEPGPYEDWNYHNWAFFPLFPLAWHFAGKLTGEYPLTGIALSNLLFFFALLVLHKTALTLSGDEGIAHRTVFYTSIFPMSYFFSLPMSESLFLLLTVGTFLSALKERWALAGIVGALASATRVSGLLLLPAVLILYFENRRQSKFEPRLLWLLLMPMGLFCFVVYLFVLTGNPLAFLGVQSAWGHTGRFFLAPLAQYVNSPFFILGNWDLRALNFAAATLALICGLVLARRREWAMAFYTIVSMVMPLSAEAPHSLQSLARYSAVLFPIFYLLARWGSSKLIDQTVCTIFAVLLGILTASYALFLTFALS